MHPDFSAQSLLLIPLVSGFLFLEICNWTRFHFRRQLGYRVFLWAAATGVLLLGTTRLILWRLPPLLAETPLDRAVAASRDFVHQYADFSFAGTSIGSLLLGVSLALGCNLIFSKNWALMKNAEQNETFLHLLLSAHESQQPVLVTLKNRKSYVGYVTDLSHLDLEMPYCRLLPTLSGYRTEEELHLELPTVYEKSEKLVRDFYAGTADDDDVVALRQLQIVLDRQEIISAHFFDEELYAEHYSLRYSELFEDGLFEDEWLEEGPSAHEPSGEPPEPDPGFVVPVVGFGLGILCALAAGRRLALHRAGGAEPEAVPH